MFCASHQRKNEWGRYGRGMWQAWWRQEMHTGIWLKTTLTLTDEAQTALFKDPVRTAL